VTLKIRSICAITLARIAPSEYQVTYWNDGVARFDGRSGPRQGAWDAHVEPAWFNEAAQLTRSLQPGRRISKDTLVTLVLDTIDDRLSYEASETDEPPGFWTLSTLIDGMCQRTRWFPLDTTGLEDFTRFGAGTPVWMTIAGATATGLSLDGTVLVLAGAQASTKTTSSLEEVYKRKRSELIDDGSLALDEDIFRLTRHMPFPSPSAAASVLAGSNTSGRRAWRNAAGRPWSELGLDRSSD
jgi:hypothetical protein